MDDDEAPDPRDARRRDPEGKKREAWEQTLADLDALAEERRAEGWEVVTVMAAHTDTKSLDMGEDDEFGLIHVIPDNQAEDFEAMWDPEAFTEYLAYGTRVHQVVYLITEFIDPEAKRSIAVAGAYDLVFAGAMVQSAEARGYLPTHLKTVDGTRLATFEHEEYEPIISPAQ